MKKEIKKPRSNIVVNSFTNELSGGGGKFPAAPQLRKATLNKIAAVGLRPELSVSKYATTNLSGESKWQV
jgi:hypothetical protein